MRRKKAKERLERQQQSRRACQVSRSLFLAEIFQVQQLRRGRSPVPGPFAPCACGSGRCHEQRPAGPSHTLCSRTSRVLLPLRVCVKYSPFFSGISTPPCRKATLFFVDINRGAFAAENVYHHRLQPIPCRSSRGQDLKPVQNRFEDSFGG